MRFYSTKYQAPKVLFKEAIMRSEAPDGGLYMPQTIPVLPKAFLNNIPFLSANEIAFVISNMLIGSGIASADLKCIIDQAFNFDIPLTKVDENIYMAELFHGPTRTMKDIGSRFLALMLSHYNQGAQNINVLLATSGNTGNAVASGMLNIPGINVITLFPIDSPDYRLLNQHVDSSNVHLIGVNGTVEQCRAMLNEALNDPTLANKHIITSANSTNIGRTFGYVFVYFYIISQLLKRNPNAKEVMVSVPSANCGNLLAGCIAKKMGLGIDKLIAACNPMGSIHNFLSGQLPSDVQQTMSYAMDVRVPSNIERFVDIYKTPQGMKKHIDSLIVSDEETQQTILNAHRDLGLRLDPHSAIAYKALKEKLPSGQIGIFMATAHPDVAQDVHQYIKIKSEHNKSKKRFIRDADNHGVAPTYPALRKLLTQILI